jgi:enamine deaminase RidA (YjgF/YER057c/UK114 family)
MACMLGARAPRKDCGNPCQHNVDLALKACLALMPSLQAAISSEKVKQNSHCRQKGCATLGRLVFLSPGATMSVYDKLKELDITLPEVALPAAAYLPYMQSGNLVFLSGHIAKKNGQPWVGKLGENMGTDEGKQAARAVAIDLMGTLQHACSGDLNRVKRIVKVMSLVNSSTSYTEQHLVTNGCSELLGEVFGDAGKHARSAFGVAQIPMGCCVEIELIAELA